MNGLDKLKIDRYPRRLLIHGERYDKKISDFPFMQDDDQSFDFIFAFIDTLVEMDNLIHDVADKQQLNKEGYFFIAYPKLQNTIGKEGIHRDHLFPALKVNRDTGVILGTDLKFNRMLSFDDDYTLVGLKRTQAERRDTDKNQRVETHVHQIPELIQRLSQYPDTQSLYQALTPGYQKEWARYIYSAKAEATQEKRFLEMIDLLSQGYKSKNTPPKK